MDPESRHLPACARTGGCQAFRIQNGILVRIAILGILQIRNRRVQIHKERFLAPPVRGNAVGRGKGIECAAWPHVRPRIEAVVDIRLPRAGKGPDQSRLRNPGSVRSLRGIRNLRDAEINRSIRQPLRLHAVRKMRRQLALGLRCEKNRQHKPHQQNQNRQNQNQRHPGFPPERERIRESFGGHI